MLLARLNRLTGPTAFTNNWAWRGGAIFNSEIDLGAGDDGVYTIPVLTYPDDTVFEDNTAEVSILALAPACLLLVPICSMCHSVNHDVCFWEHLFAFPAYFVLTDIYTGVSLSGRSLSRKCCRTGFSIPNIVSIVKMHDCTGFQADFPVFTNEDWKRLLMSLTRNQRQDFNRSSVHNVSMTNPHRSRPGTRTHPLMGGILSAENDFGILTAKEENQTTPV